MISEAELQAALKTVGEALDASDPPGDVRDASPEVMIEKGRQTINLLGIDAEALERVANAWAPFLLRGSEGMSRMDALAGSWVDGVMVGYVAGRAAKEEGEAHV